MNTTITRRICGAVAAILLFISVAAAQSVPFSVDYRDVGDIAIEIAKPTMVKTGVMPIPEPSSILLLGTGVAGLVARKLKKRNKNSARD